VSGEVSVVSRRRRSVALRRRIRVSRLTRRVDDVLYAGCALLALLAFVALMVWPRTVPFFAFGPVVVVAGLFLPVRRLLVVYAGILLACLALGVRHDHQVLLVVLAVAALLTCMVMMLLVAQSRARIGTRGFHGDNLLVDLRDRIGKLGRLPALPQGWDADSRVHSANGERFSGDFVVVSVSPDGRRLEVALVDVSGKGKEAGARSLLLSGAFGGLLGSVEPEQFLRAANSYLVRQGWDEGFATAVHIAVDLTSGEFSAGWAGHPPPAQYAAGSGTWAVLTGGRGPLLGVMDSMAFPRTSGQLHHGDALLLYSDGVIESRGHDLSEGVDRMLGVATRAHLDPKASIAQEVCRAARSGEGDDRAAFVLCRT
jgi:hypothetical protein